MSGRAKHLYEFGPFRLDTGERLLLREGRPVHLTVRAFDLLLVLVEKNGHVVEKDELMKAVWSDSVVEEANLTVQISTLRKALGEGDPDGNKYIETIPKRGYRFVAGVKEVAGESPAVGAGQHLEVNVTTKANGLASDYQEKDIRPDGQKAWPVEDRRGRDWRPRSRMLALCLLTIGILGTTAYLWRARQTKEGATAEGSIKSIAVLPFKSLGVSQTENEYLEMGVTDTLINKLSVIEQLIIRPSGAVSRYAGHDHNPIIIGRELKVDAVLAGRIQKAEDPIRVAVQLVAVRNGKTLWADNFDEQFTDIFKVQDAISEQVTQALRLKLAGGEQQRLRKHHTEDPEAYRAYLRGRYFWNKRTEQDLRKAVEHFQQAVERDPAYALAYTGLADSYALLAGYGALPSREAGDTLLKRARAYAQRALAIDEELAEAHASLANIIVTSGWDWSGAERAYQRAIELNPNYATAHQWYAEYLGAKGQVEGHFTEIRRAQEMDPLSPIIARGAGGPYYQSRRYEEAITEYRKALDLVPDFWPAYASIACAYSHLGKHEEAIAAARKAQEITAGNLESTYILGITYGLAGKRAETLHIIAELNE